MIKIAYFGTPSFAVLPLKKLVLHPEFEVISVITQPDRPVGRKKIMTPPPVKEAAEKLGIKIYQPKNKKELEKIVKNLPKVDFFIVIAYGMIFQEELLDIPKIASINVHASLLPKYRGASPIQEALLNGDKETGISIIKMNKELDAGNIYLLKRISIKDDENTESMSERISELSAEILPHALKDIKDGILTPIPQAANPTFCRKIQKNDGKINWKTQTAEEIKNMIRAYAPWPSVFCEFKNKKLKILEAEIGKDDKIKPGEFIFEGKILKIGTKKYTILPKKLQLEGKNEMDVKAFANGYKS